MKRTKRRIEPLSFFDHTGISGHLEKRLHSSLFRSALQIPSSLYPNKKTPRVHRVKKNGQ